MASKVVFNADTGQFVTAVDGMDKSVVRSAENVAKAKNAILDWGRSSVEAAQEAGKSAETQARIMEQASQRIASVTETNASRISKALNDQKQKTQEVTAAYQQLSNVISITEAKQAESSFADSFSEKQQGAALARAIGGRGSMRTAEAAFSALPGVAELSSAVFPAVALGAFVGLVGEGVSKLKEMYENLQKMPEAIRTGFDSLNQPLLLTTDSLRLENDQMESMIAKLEHKPVNRTAEALDEARVNADKLTESAIKAQQEVSKLLKENESGFWGSFVFGRAQTGPDADEIGKRMAGLTDLDRKNQDATHSGSDTKAAQEERQGVYDKALADFKKYLQGRLTAIKQYQQNPELNRGETNIGRGDQSAVSATLTGALQWVYGEQDYQTELARQAKLKPQLEGLRGQDKEPRDRAQRAPLASLQRLREQMNQPAPYLPNMLSSGMVDPEAQKKLAEAQEKAIQSQAAVVAMLGKAKIEYDLSTGAITSQTAAERLAANAAQEHASKLAALSAQMGKLKDSSFNPVLNQWTSTGDQTKYVELGIDANKELAAKIADNWKEQADLVSQTWSGALIDANTKFVASSLDTAKQVQAIYGDIANGINKSFTQWATHPNQSGAQIFQGFGKDLFTSVTSMGIGRLEGSALGALGLGKSMKRDGSSAAQAMFVQLVGIGAMTGGASGVLGSLVGSAAKSSTSDSSTSSGVGTTIGKVVGALATAFGGGLAVGGGVDSSKFYLTGEHGPELFFPGVSGRVMNNRDTSAMMGAGGDTHHHWNIDARGATDPAMVNYQVQRGIMKAAPQIMAATKVNMKSERDRTPSMKK